MGYEEEVISRRLRIIRLEKFEGTNSFADDVSMGLSASHKFLLPKYFYDDKGSELFEKICATKEYYPTLTEISILKNLSGSISERNMDKDIIIELGSGSSYKTGYILEAFCRDRDEVHYYPIDVSDIIIESSKALTDRFRNLNVTGLISFYQEGLDFIISREHKPKLILFLGSSIGNFTAPESVEFMKMLKNDMTSEDRLLIGFDMVKDRKVLVDAYNDSAGVTAEFNLNILRRINTELDGDFQIDKFEHQAVFNEEKSRIEMYLMALEEMKVTINKMGKSFYFKKGEKIHTENSYKFTHEMIDKLARDSGLEFSDRYSDEKNYFSLCAFKLINDQ